MAGALNSLYLIVAIGVAVVGLGAVTKLVSDSNRTDSGVVELSSILVAILFVLALGVEFFA